MKYKSHYLTIGIIVVMLFGFVVYYNHTTSILEPIHICDYKACCNSNINERYNTCDYMGCNELVPNWTPPICEK